MPDRSQVPTRAHPSEVPQEVRTRGIRVSQQEGQGFRWKRYQHNHVITLSAALLGMGIVLLVAWPGLGHPSIARFVPAAITWSPTVPSGAVDQGPDAQHWFGTDAAGRDLLSRTVYGARLALLFGVTVTGMSLLIGVTGGALAGASGGRWDTVLGRVGGVLRSSPLLVLWIAVIAWLQGPWLGGAEPLEGRLWLLQENLLRLAVVFGFLLWPLLACEVRDRLVVLRRAGHVEAACLLGVHPVRILRRHVWPELVGTVVLWLVRTLPVVILYETFLSFVGLGIQPPDVSLGALLLEGAARLHEQPFPWWLAVFPAGVLLILVVVCQALALGLRSAWRSPGRIFP
jgi:oligopeptide transport system permease protein